MPKIKSKIIIIGFALSVAGTSNAYIIFDAIKSFTTNMLGEMESRNAQGIDNTKKSQNEQKADNVNSQLKSEQNDAVNLVTRESSLKTSLHNHQLLQESKPSAKACEYSAFSKQLKDNNCSYLNPLDDFLNDRQSNADKEKAVVIKEQFESVVNINSELKTNIMLGNKNYTLKGDELEKERVFVNILIGNDTENKVESGTLSQNNSAIYQMSNKARRSVAENILLAKLSRFVQTSTSLSFYQNLFAIGESFGGGNKYKSYGYVYKKGSEGVKQIVESNAQETEMLRELTMKKAYKAYLRVEQYKRMLDKEALVSSNLIKELDRV